VTSGPQPHTTSQQLRGRTTNLPGPQSWPITNRLLHLPSRHKRQNIKKRGYRHSTVLTTRHSHRTLAPATPADAWLCRASKQHLRDSAAKVVTCSPPPPRYLRPLESYIALPSLYSQKKKIEPDYHYRLSAHNQAPASSPSLLRPRAPRVNLLPPQLLLSQNADRGPIQTTTKTAISLRQSSLEIRVLRRTHITRRLHRATTHGAPPFTLISNHP